MTSPIRTLPELFVKRQRDLDLHLPYSEGLGVSVCVSPSCYSIVPSDQKYCEECTKRHGAREPKASGRKEAGEV